MDLGATDLNDIGVHTAGGINLGHSIRVRGHRRLEQPAKARFAARGAKAPSPPPSPSPSA